MSAEHELALMRGMLNDLIAKVDVFVAASEKRDAEYDKLRRRMLRGALGLLGTNEADGENPA